MNDDIPRTESPRATLEMIDVDVPTQRSPGQAVLEHVNWQVASGDYWLVCGLHRSGKSDLLAVASGILPPLRGVCRLFGQEVSRGTRTGLAGDQLRVGLVFDGGQLLHDLTLAENVALPLAYHQNMSWGHALQRVEPLLELTGLGPWKRFYPRYVSRIWQQRADLARALALEPELLLVDNPWAGLDPQNARWWLQMLDNLAAGHPACGGKPKTLVVTVNSLAFWSKRAQRFAVLANKQLVILRDRPGSNNHDQSLIEPLMPSGEVPV